jgi:hypothetical protein
MAGKQKNCGANHRFREHGIGAGLTRRICTGCGLLEIGQGRKPVLVESPFDTDTSSILTKAG